MQRSCACVTTVERRHPVEETKWLIAREIPHLRRYALALVRDREAADDLVQDSLERALKKRHLWRRQGSIRSWLLRVLYNVYLTQLRGRRRRRAAVPLHEVEMVRSDERGVGKACVGRSRVWWAPQH